MNCCVPLWRACAAAVLMAAAGVAQAEDYLSGEQFLASAFADTRPEQKTLWISNDMRQRAQESIGVVPSSLRVRYWSAGARTAWVLEQQKKAAAKLDDPKKVWALADLLWALGAHPPPLGDPLSVLYRAVPGRGTARGSRPVARGRRDHRCDAVGKGGESCRNARVVVERAGPRQCCDALGWSVSCGAGIVVRACLPRCFCC